MIFVSPRKTPGLLILQPLFTMRIIKYFIFVCFFLYVLSAKSQNGLENILVEKYYVSGAGDTTAGQYYGNLPAGSTTYRIYLDMLPGYKFYAAYGAEGHELKIETSTTFFNNASIGNTYPNVIPRRSLGKNTVMLDSWFSAGAAGEDFYGVLKEQDDSLETIKHEGPFLQNKNKLAGIPVKDRDGLKVTANVPWPSFFGIDSLTPIFFRKCEGSSFSTFNGAWGCLGGSMGPDSLTTNRLLIAQLTTNGDLSFELNVQIGKPNVIIEQYVARNPVKDEITLPCLIYTSKQPVKPSKLTASKNKNTSNKK